MPAKLSLRDNVIKSLLIGALPTLGFIAIALITLQRHPLEGMAALSPVIYAGLALLTAYLVVDGDNWLIVATAVVAPVTFGALLPDTEANTIVAARFFAALSVCGFSYCILRKISEFLDAVIGLLVCVVIGGFIGAAGFNAGPSVTVCGSVLLLFLFVVVRVNGKREYDKADEQRDKEDPPDAPDFDPTAKNDEKDDDWFK